MQTGWQRERIAALDARSPLSPFARVRHYYEPTSPNVAIFDGTSAAVLPALMINSSHTRGEIDHAVGLLAAHYSLGHPVVALVRYGEIVCQWKEEDERWAPSLFTFRYDSGY